MRNLALSHAVTLAALVAVLSFQVGDSWRRYELLEVQRARVSATPLAPQTAMDLAVGDSAPYHSTIERLTPADATIVFSATVTTPVVETYFRLGRAVFPRRLIALGAPPSRAAIVLDSKAFDGDPTFVLDVGNEIRGTGRHPVTILEKNAQFTLYRLEGRRPLK